MLFALSLLTLLALTTPSNELSTPAQDGLQTARFQTLGSASLHVATGELVRGNSQDKSAGLAAAFVNTDTSGFYGTGFTVHSTTGNATEWVDFGVITTDTGSELVGRFTFGYGTSVLDTTLGGPGAQLTLRFFDGITGFCADSGSAPTASFSFTDLPGAAPGTEAAWIITVDLTGGFEFASSGVGNHFGLGVSSFDDYDADFNQDTGPLFCYAGDPAGPNSSATIDPDTNGQVNAIDLWDAASKLELCLGTFFIRGTLNIASFYLAIDTADTTGAAAASATFRNAGSNPGNYSVTAVPRLGSSYGATDTQSNGGLGIFVVGYATTLGLATPYGHLLVNVSDPAGPLLTGHNGPYPFTAGTAAVDIPIPTDLTLCGFSLSTQSLEFGGGIQLHNAQDLILGF